MRRGCRPTAFWSGVSIFVRINEWWSDSGQWCYYFLLSICNIELMRNLLYRSTQKRETEWIQQHVLIWWPEIFIKKLVLQALTQLVLWLTFFSVLVFVVYALYLKWMWLIMICCSFQASVGAAMLEFWSTSTADSHRYHRHTAEHFGSNPALSRCTELSYRLKRITNGATNIWQTYFSL